MTYIDNPSRIQADALDRVRETAAALYRIIARIEHASTHARLEMERGALPSGGGIGGAAYLGHQTPNDLTIATVRVNDAIDHARIVGLDGDQINAAYDFAEAGAMADRYARRFDAVITAIELVGPAFASA